jgi:hypothetical protein
MTDLRHLRVLGECRAEPSRVARLLAGSEVEGFASLSAGPTKARRAKTGGRLLLQPHGF